MVCPSPDTEAPVKAAGGKREYVKTLKTGDLNEANRLKYAHVAAFKRQIEALDKNGKTSGALHDLYEKALAWRETMEKAKGEVLWTEPDGTPFYLTDEFLDQNVSKGTCSSSGQLAPPACAPYSGSRPTEVWRKWVRRTPENVGALSSRRR
jgi:hypothetical protein